MLITPTVIITTTNTLVTAVVSGRYVIWNCYTYQAERVMAPLCRAVDFPGGRTSGRASLM